ncbi:MAG TPA: hypothetical protein VKA05_01750, partial [Acidimicrobiales bacterium]|nr:hypothetical protein [Acidimicrobiales bacterium]
MAGRIEPVVPGAHAEAALAAAVGGFQASDRLAPVFVAVRTPTVALSLRRRLASVGPFAAVRFAPLPALVRLIGVAEAAAGARQPLTSAALRVAARLALSEGPGVLEPVAGHAATEGSLVATFRDLRRASEDDLERLATSSARAHDVVRLAARMRQLLEVSFYDEVDLVLAATDRLGRAAAGGAGGGAAGAAAVDEAVDGAAGAAEAAGAAGAAEIGKVVVYLPDPLRPAEIVFLAALAAVTDVLVLAARCGDELADRGTGRLCEALVATGSFEAWAGAMAGVEQAGTAPALAPARFDRMLSAPDDDVEARQAVRCLAAHGEAGGDLGRCVVTFPDSRRSEDIGRRVVEQLRAAGIASSGPSGRRLSDTPHGRLFADLLRLASPRPAGQELDRGEVMSWIGCGPLRPGSGLTRGLASVESAGGVPLGLWDR